jgi:hypothetical protein
VTEELYFHISKADLIEMEMEEHKNTYVKDGETLIGMQAKLQKMIDSEDGKAIMEELKDMILRSYGKKEGDRFIKTQALREEFAASEAFSQLLWELCTDATAASEFINGIVPGNLEQIAEDVRLKAEQARIAGAEPVKAEENGEQPASATPVNTRVLTQAEVAEMDSDELKSGLATGRYKLS